MKPRNASCKSTIWEAEVNFTCLIKVDDDASLKVPKCFLNCIIAVFFLFPQYRKSINRIKITRIAWIQISFDVRMILIKGSCQNYFRQLPIPLVCLKYKVKKMIGLVQNLANMQLIEPTYSLTVIKHTQ